MEFFLLTSYARGKSFIYRSPNFFYGVALGIALGSIAGSLGEIIGVGDVVGISRGVRIVPLFVCSMPPESRTSFT